MDISKAILLVRKFSTRNTLSNQLDLFRFARKFLKERIDSLDKDVKHCLKRPYAPFPAILYCFSTVDLLGALYAGHAEKKIRITTKPTGRFKMTPYDVPTAIPNSRRYMKRFMNYDSESIRLLQEIFRHKMVHLAVPKPSIKDKNRIIAWRYYHYRRNEHLKLKKLMNPKKVKGTTPYDIYCNFGFHISIVKFRDDIKDSIIRKQTGYLQTLIRNERLQYKFRKAINEIYNPILVR